MSTEELFRDEKSLRYGWGLGQTQLSEPERLERLLLVLACAYMLLVLMGLNSTFDVMRRGFWRSGAL